MAAKVLMVVSGGEYIVSKNLAGVFELMGWKPRQKRLGSVVPKWQESKKGRECLLFVGFYSSSHKAGG